MTKKKKSVKNSIKGNDMLDHVMEDEKRLIYDLLCGDANIAFAAHEKLENKQILQQILCACVNMEKPFSLEQYNNSRSMILRIANRLFAFRYKCLIDLLVGKTYSQERFDKNIRNIKFWEDDTPDKEQAQEMLLSDTPPKT